MSTGKLLSGIIVGAAAGAVLGILFAPEKGCDTRQKLRQSADDLVSNLKNKVNSARTTMSDKFEDVTERSENMSGSYS